MIIGELLRTAVYPLLTAMALAFFGGSLMGQSQRAKDAWLGLGLVLGFATGFLSIIGWVPFPAIQVTHWLLWLGVFAWLGFCLLNLLGRRFANLGGFILLGLTPFILLKPFFNRWSSLSSVAWVLGLTSILFLLFVSIQASPREKGSAARFWVLIVAATGASLIHVLDGGALSGQLGGVLAAACGGLFLVSCFGRGLRIGWITHGIFVTLFASILILGHFYVEVAPMAILLVGLSPLALWWHRLPAFEKWPKSKQFGVTLVTVLIPVMVAVGLLIARASEASYSGY